MNSLSLSYRAEDQWHGELTATVESGDFCGRGAAWFTLAQLQEFARLARTYPIAEGQEPRLIGGFWDDDGQRLKQCHLSIQLSLHDRQGSIRLTVALGTQTQDDDDRDLRHTLTARFLTTYADIDRFGLALTSLLEGQTDAATLQEALI